MLEKAEEVLIGVQLLMKAIGVQRAIIGIENNKPDAIEHLKQLASKNHRHRNLPLETEIPARR